MFSLFFPGGYQGGKRTPREEVSCVRQCGICTATGAGHRPVKLCAKRTLERAEAARRPQGSQGAQSLRSQRLLPRRKQRRARVCAQQQQQSDCWLAAGVGPTQLQLCIAQGGGR